MKKIKEFMLALGHVPKLFKTVYKTDKLYLFYMIGETICFAFVPYPTLYLSKYALDALENGSKFSDFTIKPKLLNCLCHVHVNKNPTFHIDLPCGKWVNVYRTKQVI